MALSLLRRLGLYLLTLFLASLLVFVATEVLPGDALEVSLTSEELSLMTHEDLDRRRAELGLDRPAALRYMTWLGAEARRAVGGVGEVLGEDSEAHQTMPPLGWMI